MAHNYFENQSKKFVQRRRNYPAACFFEKKVPKT